MYKHKLTDFFPVFTGDSWCCVEVDSPLPMSEEFYLFTAFLLIFWLYAKRCLKKTPIYQQQKPITIAHFRVLVCLCLKASFRAKLFI